MKEIYSLNLIAYIKMVGLDYELHTDNGKLFYAKVEDDEDIDSVIGEYKDSRDLQEFLDCFRELRSEINSMRV